MGYYLRRRPVDEPPAIYEDDPTRSAIDAVMDLEFDNPLRALEIVFAIARKSTDDWVLVNLGAGPLETLLSHDPSFLDAVRIEARVEQQSSEGA